MKPIPRHTSKAYPVLLCHRIASALALAPMTVDALSRCLCVPRSAVCACLDRTLRLIVVGELGAYGRTYRLVRRD
jgi:hypothetical protein